MRFLLGADFHLGARMKWLGAAADSRREDLKRALTRFADRALESDVDAVLLLGDLFDHHAPDSALTGFASRQIERMLERVPVVAVPGTHDGYGYPDSVYRSGKLPAGLRVITSPSLSRITIDVGPTPVHLYGLAYDPGRTPQDPLSGLGRDPEVPDGLHIAMIHGSIPAGPEWDMRRRDMAIPTADLSGSGLHLLALGHYHNFMEKRFGDTLAVYPGTLEGLKFSETGERAFTIVDLTDAGARVERSPYPGIPVLDESLDLSRMANPAADVEAAILARSGPEVIARFRLTGEAPVGFDAAFTAARLEDRFRYLAIDDRTVRLDPAWTEQVAGERTIRGLFTRKMRERIAGSDDTARPVLEAALRLGLMEFHSRETAHVD